MWDILMRAMVAMCSMYHVVTLRRLAFAQPCALQMDTSCKCFQELECSSCLFQSCPLPENKIQSVQKMTHGLTGSSWRLDFEDGPPLLLKLEYPSVPVALAQIAHQLGVPTPPVLRVKRLQCPVLLDAVQAKALPEVFRQDLKSRSSGGVTLQAFVEPSTDVFPGCQPELGEFSSRPWVQVGIIAMFDWLVGKTDTFIDWKLSKDTEDEPQNRHNILISKELGKAVNIDLSISGRVDMPEYLENLRSVLADLTAGVDVEWIRDNVMDVFDGFSLGYDEGPQSLQVQLGMAYGLREILEHADTVSQMLARTSGSLRTLHMMHEALSTPNTTKTRHMDLGGLCSDLPCFQSIVRETDITATSTLCASLEARLRRKLSKPIQAPMRTLCSVQCWYKTNHFLPIFSKWKTCKGGLDNDGSFLVAKPSEGDCSYYFKSLTPASAFWKCGPVCKSGRRIRAGGVKTVTIPGTSEEQ